jgi:hypothetical protein
MKLCCSVLSKRRLSLLRPLLVALVHQNVLISQKQEIYIKTARSTKEQKLQKFYIYACRFGKE